MNSKLLKNSLRFLGLILLQVLVLNNINFLGYINPYLYLIFLLLYPFNSNRSLFLLLAFLLGLSIDIFEDTGGIHAAACLVAAFLRPNLLRFSFGISYDHQNLRLSAAPFGEKLSYVCLMVIIHHLVLFSLQMFSFSHILFIGKETLFTSLFTILMVFLSLAIFSKKYR